MDGATAVARRLRARLPRGGPGPARPACRHRVAGPAARRLHRAVRAVPPIHGAGPSARHACPAGPVARSRPVRAGVTPASAAVPGARRDPVRAAAGRGPVRGWDWVLVPASGRAAPVPVAVAGAWAAAPEWGSAGRSPGGRRFRRAGCRSSGSPPLSGPLGGRGSVLRRPAYPAAMRRCPLRRYAAAVSGERGRPPRGPGHRLFSGS